jgi:RNA polymerase sigma-70 factor (family 1)
MQPGDYDISSPAFLQAFRKGDEAAFDHLFREYFSMLSLFAYRITGDTAISEDIVQTCFEKLWKKRRSLDYIQSVKSYLYTSVRYGCITYIKKKKNGVALESLAELADMKGNAESAMILAETIKQVHDAIAALPPRMQQVFRMYYLEGRSYREIGEMLNTEPETIRNQRFKALQLVRKTIIPTR